MGGGVGVGKRGYWGLFGFCLDLGFGSCEVVGIGTGVGWFSWILLWLWILLRWLWVWYRFQLVWFVD